MATNRPLSLIELLRGADPTSRREFLRRAAATGLGLPALGALLAACATPGPVTGPPATALPAVPNPQPKRGGTFTTLGHQTVTSLSPDDDDPTVLYVLAANIHESLLKVDQNYQLAPVLAERYQVAPDAKTWTFNLRQGVTWHDGQPFTAADVKYNFDWLKDPSRGAIGQPLFQEVDHVETPNDTTVVVSLTQPNAAFAALTATRLLVPKHVHEKIGEKAYKQQPVGTGPFKLKELRPAEYCLLEANDTYWGGRPWIDAWRQNVVPEVAVRGIALQTGQADSSTWPLTPEDHLKLMDDPRFRVYRSPGMAVNHFVINDQRPLLSDKRVRQAMLYAIDRDALVRDLMKGLAVKATSNLSPALEGFYEPNVRQYPRDLDKARALLKEAGWTPGPDGILVNAAGERYHVTCVVLVGDALRRSEAEIVQRQFQEVGIEMELREAEPTTALSAARSGDFDLELFNWTYGGDAGEPDARTTLRSDGLNNVSHWKHAEADRLVDAGAVEVDPDKRRKLYGELQQLVAEEVPFLYLMYWETVLLFNRRIKGMPSKAANPYQLYLEFRNYWIEEG